MSTVSCVYRTPLASKIEDEILLEALGGMLVNSSELLIVGDFNKRSIDWETKHVLAGSTGDRFPNWLHGFALHQHVRQPTRYRRD